MKKRLLAMLTAIVMTFTMFVSTGSTSNFCSVESTIAFALEEQRQGREVVPFIYACLNNAVTNEQLVKLVEFGILCPIKTISITTNGGTLSNLTPLADFTNLTHLDLGRNQISDLTPLSGLTNLRALFLENNQITDVSPLSGLVNLGRGIARLDLTNNNISNVMPLSTLIYLDTTTLHLEGNPVANDHAQLTELATVRQANREATGRRILTLGHILGEYEWTIADALEILRYTVGLPSIIDECDIAKLAALIVSEETPGIADALQILRHLVDLPSALD